MRFWENLKGVKQQPTFERLQEAEARFEQGKENQAVACKMCTHIVCRCPKMFAPDTGHEAHATRVGVCRNCGLQEATWRAVRLSCAQATQVARDRFENIVRERQKSDRQTRPPQE